MTLPPALTRIVRNLADLGGRRLALLGTVGTTVVLAVITVAHILGQPDYETLYSGLNPQDSGRIGQALREGGLAFDISSDGARVLVHRGQSVQARTLLAERGLPSGTTAGYELFDKLGPLGLTTFMQEVTRARALEGELARTIQAMKGVKSARVHVVLPDGSSFRRTRQPPSASVVLRIDAASAFTSGQAVRHLVAAAVPGMTIENVRVVGTDGSLLAGPVDGAIAGSSHHVELERTVSKDVQDSIRRTLAPFLGLDNFEISATARLNIDKRQASETTYDPESKAERSVRVVKETSNSQNAGPRNAATVEQNLPAEPAPSPSAEQSKRTQERREELTNFELASKSVQTLSEGYRIDNLAIAVVVNRKRLSAAASEVGNGALETQVKEIERLVASAAGVDARRGDKVVVSAVDFADLPADQAPASTWAAALAASVPVLAKVFGVVAAAFVLAWFGLRPASQLLTAPERQAGLESDRDAGPHVAITAVRSSEGQGLLSAASTGPANTAATSRERLIQIVEGDEDRAAMVLKHLINGESG